MTQIKVLLTLIAGVASLRVTKCAPETDQSDLILPDEQPIGSLENYVGKRRLETPEVVLQLKYESGELNRIYLAQFRKEKEPWVPSVPARTNLCADLCHAGLGGPACGASCSGMLPVGLQSALQRGNQSGASGARAAPRVAVCPTLCHNHLGYPLCGCGVGAQDLAAVEWNDICSAFCDTDRYVLGGCPECEEASTLPPLQLATTRILDTNEGWVAWCGVQCVQGQGGAACNCDRAPL